QGPTLRDRRARLRPAARRTVARLQDTAGSRTEKPCQRVRVVTRAARDRREGVVLRAGVAVHHAARYAALRAVQRRSFAGWVALVSARGPATRASGGRARRQRRRGDAVVGETASAAGGPGHRSC